MASDRPVPDRRVVHGAFADASSWSGVITRLQAAGVAVIAPANPLRGIVADSAYLRSVIDQIPGPVLAVGHSYAGAVISNAAKGAPNVGGLVFVAAFAPDEGEVLGEVTPTSKDSVLMTALVPRQYPSTGGGTAIEFVVDPAKFHDVFAGRPARRRSGRHGRHATACRGHGIRGAERAARMEGSPVLGRRRHRRPGSGSRPRPVDGRTGERDDHGDRGVARGDGLGATGGDGRHPRSRRHGPAGGPAARTRRLRERHDDR